MKGCMKKGACAGFTLLILASIFSITATSIPATASAVNGGNANGNAKIAQDPVYDGVMYNSHEYKLFIAEMTWTEAKADCEARGGHLVTITSDGENDFVASLFGSGPDQMWIGFTDELTEGDWQWVTGEDVIYTNWNSGEPSDDPPGEDYAAMYVDGVWNDLADFAAGSVDRYTCEWEGENGIETYTSHDPVFIDGNADFISQATTEGWPGDGSETNPIIIDNLKITYYFATAGNDLINIRNTDLHYQIRNCFLNGLGGGQGISLNEASNGNVYKNTIGNTEGFGIYVERSSNAIVAQNTLSNTGGISLWESSSNTVTDNTVYSDSGPAGGIGLDNSHDNVIENNFIYANGGGIGLGGSDNNLISSNKVVGDGSNDGITISASKNNTVSNNTAYGCFAGIYVQGASNNVVSGNLVSYNTFRGILVEHIPGEFTAADNNIIDSNTAFFNNEGGIAISGPANSNNVTNNLVHTNHGGIRVEGSDNVITGNDLYDNNLGGSQAVDDGTNNVFAGNYWNDWTSPGLPYAIDGAANNQDPSPRVAPSFDTHQLISLILLYPISGITFSGTVNIQWTYTGDLQDHAVTYSVYYSPDNGESWILLASDLITNSYEWDTIQVSNGNYRIKVIASCSEGLTAEDSSSGIFSIDQSYIEPQPHTEPAPDLDIIQLLFNLLSLVFTIAVLLAILAVGVIFFYFAQRVLMGMIAAIASRTGSKTQVIYHATVAASGNCDFCGTKIKEGDYFCPYCYRRIARKGGRRILRRTT